MVGVLDMQRTVDAVDRICATAPTADELLEELASELHRAVPHDGALWFGADPVTMLATAPSRVEGLDEKLCDTFWHLEFHEQDTGLFADLARDGDATALRLSLDDRPARSIRYREFLVPQGYGDEMRGAFRAGNAVWGFVGFYRQHGHPAFSEDDLALVRAISNSVGSALRNHFRESVPWVAPSAPGLLVVDRLGRAISSNTEARCWLRDLWPNSVDEVDTDRNRPVLDIAELRDDGMGVASSLYALVARARAVAEGRERAPARLRVRDRRGRWLVLHATPMSGPDGDDAAVAVVIEAAKSAEIAPIIIEAYSLTPRERDVLGAIARGGSTAEIAGELFLSPHTVRDHVKAVFEKFGVSSRSELVARLFGEHYSDRLHDTMVHVS
jgi:DNA-binding CsgD family transcriptional regulator